MKRRLMFTICCLLVMSLCASALAEYGYEDEYDPYVRFDFTQGKDLVIYDGPEFTITMKGDQPVKKYADGYDLGFVIYNHEDKTIVVDFGYWCLNDEVWSDEDIEVTVPANSSEDCAIHVLPGLLAKQESSASASAISKIASFDGIEELQLTVDSWYVDPSDYYFIIISYLPIIRF